MRLLIFLPLFVTPACLVPSGSRPEVGAAATALSQFNFRGMVMNESGAFQPEFNVALPTRGDGSLDLHTRGNMDLSNDAGDAWFSDGHGGEFSEIDYGLSWSRPVGEFDVTAGTEVYVLPNGAEFPLGARSETKEVFVHVGRAVGRIYPSASVHYDYDAAEGLYALLAAESTFDLAANWTLVPRLSVAWNDAKHASWVYGSPQSGLADGRLGAQLVHRWNANTQVEFSAIYSTILDSELADWIESIGIEPDNLFFGLGLRWAY